MCDKILLMSKVQFLFLVLCRADEAQPGAHPSSANASEPGGPSAPGGTGAPVQRPLPLLRVTDPLCAGELIAFYLCNTSVVLRHGNRRTAAGLTSNGVINIPDEKAFSPLKATKTFGYIDLFDYADYFINN